MVKDVYLFTNGTLAVFDEAGQQIPELQGVLTEEKKKEIEKQFYDGTRIIFSRWKKGFFDLTREEFMAAELRFGTHLELTFTDALKKVQEPPV